MSTPTTPGTTPGGSPATGVPDSPTDLGAGTTATTGTPTGTTTGTTTGGPHNSTSSAAEHGKQVAGTAAEQGKQVAGTAAEEARRVAEEGAQQARKLLGDARQELDQQARSQRDRLTDTLHGVSDDLDRMGEHASPGLAQDLVRQASQRARELGTRLDGREPTELLDEVRDLARRRPGAFLLGALAAGVVAGRLTRGARDAQQPGSGTSGTSGTSYGAATSLSEPSVGLEPTGTGVPGTATGDPLAGIGTPSEPAEPFATRDPLDPVHTSSSRGTA